MVKEINLQYYVVIIIIFIIRILILLLSSSFIIIILSWEGLGVRRFFLIYYYNTWEARINALLTIITMRVGEYILFLCFRHVLFINIIFSSFIYYRSLSYLIFVLFSITKSAQYPFSGWLPKAIRAPTPTRALVHSSTLVTAGAVVIIIYREILGIPTLILILLMIGAFTILIGRVLSLIERRIKKLVAFSTISQMGLAFVVFGLGNFNVGIINLVSHGLAKSLLFIQVGYYLHTISLQQNTRLWNGVVSTESLIQVQFLITLFSLCGIIFLGGIVTKECLLELIKNNIVKIGFLIILMICIYLTFLYCILLYKSLFNNNGPSIILYGSSITLLLVTYLEVYFVITFIIWIRINFIRGQIVFLSLDNLFPFLVFIIIIFRIKKIINIILIFKFFNLFIIIISSYQIYKWLRNLISIKYVEAYLNIINITYYLIIIIISRSLLVSVNINQLIIFLVIIILL